MKAAKLVGLWVLSGLALIFGAPALRLRSHTAKDTLALFVRPFLRLCGGMPMYILKLPPNPELPADERHTAQLLHRYLCMEVRVSGGQE
jgi:hypothetical protein